jgi:hypothetical protein
VNVDEKLERIVKKIAESYKNTIGRDPIPTERRLKDTSREAILGYVDWLERNFSFLRRGSRRLPEVTIFDTEVELLFENVGRDGLEFRDALMEGKMPSGCYSMIDNTIKLAAGLPEHVLVHELAHYLQPAGLTVRQCEEIAGAAQLAWAMEFAPGDVPYVTRIVKANVAMSDDKRIHSFRHDMDFLPEDAARRIGYEWAANKRKVLI